MQIVLFAFRLSLSVSNVGTQYMLIVTHRPLEFLKIFTAVDSNKYRTKHAEILQADRG
jgi:hypothetical protein